jgi:hypothetical protein
MVESVITIGMVVGVLAASGIAGTLLLIALDIIDA